MRPRSVCIALVLAALIGGCGGKTTLVSTPPKHHRATPPSPSHSTTSASQGATTTTAATPPATVNPQKLGFPDLATKNTTRVGAGDPISVAAAVALAVFPSAAPGTHPTAVALAPTDDWQAAIAASSLMAPPFRAPVLLSGPGTLPAATQTALSLLAPTGDSAAGKAQVIQIGDVPAPAGERTTAITGSNPYALAAAIDTFEARERGKESVNVVIVSGTDPAYAMPAAGYAAESGEPVLFVTQNSVPAATQQSLLAHRHPHIYVLGPASVISNTVLADLAHYGAVKRISASTPAALSVAFAAYRDPACVAGQQCAHIPGSFGWAIRSPGHGYVLINQKETLDAPAAAALSSSGSYGPQLLVQDPTSLPKPVLDYFLDYATPGYNAQGPTVAVFNHAWLIGTVGQVSAAVQAQVDSLLEMVPEK
jgi:hypothetical protein